MIRGDDDTAMLRNVFGVSPTHAPEDAGANSHNRAENLQSPLRQHRGIRPRPIWALRTIESCGAFVQTRVSGNQFDARVSSLNKNSSRYDSGSSAGSVLSSFQRSHFAQSKPRYSIASDFVKPIRLRHRQSGKEQ